MHTRWGLPIQEQLFAGDRLGLVFTPTSAPGQRRRRVMVFEVTRGRLLTFL